MAAPVGLGQSLSEGGEDVMEPGGAVWGVPSLPATGPARLRAHLELVWGLLCSARWRPDTVRAGHAKYRVDSELGATRFIF